MKKLVLAFALAFSALAQAAPALPDSNFVYVIGRGLVQAPPDIARFEVTLRSSGPDHERAFAQLQADVAAVIAVAKAQGVAATDIDAHNIRKSNDSYDRDDKPKLPELTQTVQVVLRDLKKSVVLADSLMKMQSVHGFSAEFDVADRVGPDASAMAQAAADARQQAQTLAKLFGRKLGQAAAVSVEEAGTMRQRFGREAASFGPPAFAVVAEPASEYRIPGRIDFVRNVYVVYALE